MESVPHPPKELHPLAREILDLLRGRPEASAITLGGGIALQHYVAFRKTVDIDAWWNGEARETTRILIRECVSAVAKRHGYSVKTRSWGDTESYEIVGEEKKVFSFQISRRDVQLDPPLASAWDPVSLETFRDNLGSKMNALVERGAPRDFVDVFTVCTRGLTTPEACWKTWAEKNTSRSIREAKAKVLHRLSMLEGRRPLERIAVESERRAAAELREWVKLSLCKEDFGGPGPGP